MYFSYVEDPKRAFASLGGAEGLHKIVAGDTSARDTIPLKYR